MKLEVFSGGHGVMQCDLLRDEPELGGPRPSLAERRDDPFVLAKKSRDAPHQGRLAGPVGPEQGDPFPRRQFEIDAVQGLQAAEGVPNP